MKPKLSTYFFKNNWNHYSFGQMLLSGMLAVAIGSGAVGAAFATKNYQKANTTPTVTPTPIIATPTPTAMPTPSPTPMIDESFLQLPWYASAIGAPATPVPQVPVKLDIGGNLQRLSIGVYATRADYDGNTWNEILRGVPMQVTIVCKSLAKLEHAEHKTGHQASKVGAISVYDIDASTGTFQLGEIDPGVYSVSVACEDANYQMPETVDVTVSEKISYTVDEDVEIEDGVGGEEDADKQPEPEVEIKDTVAYVEPSTSTKDYAGYWLSDKDYWSIGNQKYFYYANGTKSPYQIATDIMTIGGKSYTYYMAAMLDATLAVDTNGVVIEKASSNSETQSTASTTSTATMSVSYQNANFAGLGPLALAVRSGTNTSSTQNKFTTLGTASTTTLMVSSDRVYEASAIAQTSEASSANSASDTTASSSSTQTASSNPTSSSAASAELATTEPVPTATPTAVPTATAVTSNSATEPTTPTEVPTTATEVPVTPTAVPATAISTENPTTPVPATPTGAPTATVAPVASATPTVSTTPTPTATLAPSATPVASATPTATPSPSPTAVPTATVKPTATPQPTGSTDGWQATIPLSENGVPLTAEFPLADGTTTTASAYFGIAITNVSETVYSGWQTIGGAKYYYDPATNKPVTGTQIINGTTYVFGANGVYNSQCQGIDVSYWQGSIDWNKVKEAGVEFVIIRAGYRGYVTGKIMEDANFQSYITGAKAAGLRVGIYFFSQAINAQEGVEEASACIKLIANYGTSYPIYIDTELSGASGNTGRADNISKADRTAAVVAFCETIQSAGYTPGIYASYSWFTTHLNFSEISRYSLWNAQWGDKNSLSGAGMWQYSATGSVNGIKGAVDRNISYIG